MSHYYKYKFITPESVFAVVKEDLKSYFDTGAVDDLMFPTYLNKCLRKLGRATIPIREIPLFIVDYQSRLPDNFDSVREAWMCAEIPLGSYQGANSFYSQTVSAETIQIAPVVVNTVPCTSPTCVEGCPECMPEVVQGVYKTNYSIERSYQQQYLLKPGNIAARSKCDINYMPSWKDYGKNFGSSSIDSFDIRDNKFVTNFRDGVVHLIFYATDYDNPGNQLIPDNQNIIEYIEAFLKFKVFEALSNQVNDETFNQIQQKLVYYKQEMDEAYIVADVEIKKQTIWQKQRAIKRDLNRLKRFELPRVARRRRRNI
jgi:hypothetical protein